MDAAQTLTISALGPFEITLDGKPLPKFKYLDSRELLVYLVYVTSPDAAGHSRGKTKQAIGADLRGEIFVALYFFS